MKKWEYKVAELTLSIGDDATIAKGYEDLKELGLAGWELVSVALNTYSGELDYYFKRELVEIDGKAMQPLKKSEPAVAKPLIAEMAILGTMAVRGLSNAKMLKVSVQCPEVSFVGEYEYAFSPSVDSMMGSPSGAPNHAAIAANIESKLREDLMKLGTNPSTIKWV